MRKILYPANHQTGNLGDLGGSFIISCKLLVTSIKLVTKQQSIKVVGNKASNW